MSAQFVFTQRQQNGFSLSAKLGSGGEGTVYAVEGNPDICVKIYHEQKRTPELEAKLKAMINAPPKDPTLAAGHYSICWPTNVVYEDEACTKFLGFTMPRIDKNTFKEYHLLCDKPGVTTSTCYRLEHFGTGFTYLHMYVVALNLASCVASIHNAGHAIGDLNDKNILVSTKDSKITIVDCDSFEIHAKDNNVFPCSVYMPEYSAPEVILHKDIKNRQESDRFALSILIFKLLMLNTHPYASRGSSVEHLNTPGEKIASGYYPYEEYADLDVNPPAYALPYELIPPNIKALFRRCFVEGQHEPEKRPSAMEWFVAIKENYEAMTAKVQNKFVMCGNNARHFFPTHLATCPWCAMPEDYFPVVMPEKKRFQKTQTQAKSLSAFEYVQKLIESFAQDNVITHEEREQIFVEAQAVNVPKEKVFSMIDEASQNNTSLIVGDIPYISAKQLIFENRETEKINIQEIAIKNNFLVNLLKVSFSSDNNCITISPQTYLLCPGEIKFFQIELNISNQDLSEKKIEVEIDLTSKNYFDKKTIDVSKYKETIPTNKKLIFLDEEKTVSDKNDPLYLLIYFALHIALITFLNKDPDVDNHINTTLNLLTVLFYIIIVAVLPFIQNRRSKK